MSLQAKPEVFAIDQIELGRDAEDTKAAVNVQPSATLRPTFGLEVPPEKKRLHRRVNLKLDLCVLPPLIFCYLMTSLDRNNVGNAQTVDFLGDVGIKAEALNTASTIFFAILGPMYPVSTYLGKRFGVMKWIPANVFLWGLFSFLHAFIKNESQFYAFRSLIAVFEAGFYPCAAYYLSSCYIRYDLGLRLGLLYGAYSIAGSFGSLIAYGLLRVGGHLRGWQILFIVEGVFTMGLGLFVYFWVPARLETAWFLNAEERDWAVTRMNLDSGGVDYQKAGITKDAFKRTLKDWKWIMVWPGQFIGGLTTSAFTTFLPLIVQQLGYKGVTANLYAVPIYVAATGGLCVFLLSSDHFKERSIHNLVAVGVSIVGLALAASLNDPRGRYAALVIMQFGIFSTGPLTVAILANNTPEPGQRALLLSTHSMGIFNGIIASQLFSKKYAPRYQIPFYVCLGGNSFMWLSFVAYYFTFKYINQWRANKVAQMTPEEIEWENSDDCPRKYEWKYTFQFAF